MYTNHGVFGGAWRSNIKLALIVDVSFNLKKRSSYYSCLIGIQANRLGKHFAFGYTLTTCSYFDKVGRS